MLGTHPLGKAGREGSEDHANRLTEHHENGIVDDEPVNGNISVHAVLKQISRHGIAESVEEIGADAYERQVNPGLVVNQVHKRLHGELLCADGLQAFLGKEAAGQGSQGRHGTQHHAQDGILMGRRSANHLLQIREGEQGDKAHGIGAHHTERGELVSLVAVIGHNAQQGAVRDVDCRIGHHHQKVHGIGINPSSRRAQIRGVQQQGKDNAQRNGPEDEPGPIGSPAGFGAVCDGTHHRVGHYVEEAGQQHQGAGIGYGKTKDIREEKGKCDGHNLPGNTTCSGISQAIAYFLGQFDGHSVFCVSKTNLRKKRIPVKPS